MREWLDQLNRLLRGELTGLEALRREGLRLPLGGMTTLIVALGVLYGLCMGCFALLHADGLRWSQTLASMLKTPALFVLTLAVTFPSLYVFNALAGSSLPFLGSLRLLVGALGVTLAVLASFGPIVAFFSVSTSSYPFMVVLNVVVFGVSGVLGLLFLLQTLRRLSLIESEKHQSDGEVKVELDDKGLSSQALARPIVPHSPTAQSAIDATPGEQDLLGTHVNLVFRCWVLVFGLVGAQMSWVLRPFIGNPRQPFTWFRPRDSNFFEAVISSLKHLFFS